MTLLKEQNMVQKYIYLWRHDNVSIIIMYKQYFIIESRYLCIIIVTSISFTMLVTHYKDIINHRKLYEMTRVIALVFANFYLTVLTGKFDKRVYTEIISEV